MQNNRRSILNFLPYLVVLVAVISLFSLNQPAAAKSLTYDQLADVLETGKVEEAALSVGSNIITVKGVYTENDKKVSFNSVVPSSEKEMDELLDKLSKAEVVITDADASNVFMELLYSLIPLIIVVGIALTLVTSRASRNKA